VSFVATATGGATDSTVVESATMSAGPDAVYLASIATRNGVAVDEVTGLGLSWQPVATRCAGRSQAYLSVWVAAGSPSQSGAVRATFAGSATSAAWR
jgi:hypothetical protein